MHYSSAAILVFLLVFLCAAVISKLLSKIIKIPYPILLMLLGILLHATQAYLLLPLQVLLSKEVAHDIILMLLLPTLVFETAYNLDISKLAANRVAIFALALPGVLLSTLTIALLITLFTTFNWQFALLLGAILSATDPSAVLSVFRQLGAPKDLIMLIEGESLFNDATAITLTKILVLSFSLAQGFWPAFLSGSGLFLVTLGGGILCGWLLAQVVSLLLHKMADDPFLETSFTLILAFASYLLAEDILHASGIVATATAGITLATKAPLPISRKSQQYLNHFWSYLSFIAMASIFLIVGLWIDLPLLWENATISLIVLGALWLSRGLIAYALLPLIGLLQQQGKTISVDFRHLVFVGGIRGAVTMALAMGVATLMQDEAILSVTVNVVFLTILLQGVLISPLAAYLGLKGQDINDNITSAELALATLRHSRKALLPLFNSSFAKTGAAQEISFKLIPMIEAQEKQLQRWFSLEVGPIGLWQRLMLRCASLEIGYLYQLFDQGLIRSAVFEELKNSLDAQMEAVRHQYHRPKFSLLPKQFSTLLYRVKLQLTRSSVQRVEQEYEMAWAKLLSCHYVLEQLQGWADTERIPAAVAAGVAKIWHGWRDNSEAKIANIEEQHPIIAAAMQRKLVRNFLHTAQSEHLQQYIQQHLISEADAENIKTLLESLEKEQLDNKL